MILLRWFLKQRRDFANKRQRCVAGYHFPEGRRAFAGWIYEGDTALRVRRLSLAPGTIVEAGQGFTCRKSYAFWVFSPLRNHSACSSKGTANETRELPNSFFQILSPPFTPLFRPTNLEEFCETTLPRPSVRSSLITWASDAFRFWQKLRASV